MKDWSSDQSKVHGIFWAVALLAVNSSSSRDKEASHSHRLVGSPWDPSSLSLQQTPWLLPSRDWSPVYTRTRIDLVGPPDVKGCWLEMVVSQPCNHLCWTRSLRGSSRDARGARPQLDPARLDRSLVFGMSHGLVWSGCRCLNPFLFILAILILCLLYTLIIDGKLFQFYTLSLPHTHT